ncbi:MAG: hypothetical protein GY854_31975 [Deltaproteobacteria bacterium]|nr:hypothetical protein [Deltaproteobacteria bacterium]
MAKSNLEVSIEKAAADFAMVVVGAVKSATLQELIALQAGGSVKAKPGRKPGRKPGPKPGRKPGRKPGPKPGRKPGRKPGPKPKAQKIVEAPKKKKRVVKNYPKCAYPRCTNNRFPRGKGFCGDHWRQFVAGKIKAADTFKKAAKPAKKRVAKKRGKK